MVRQGRLISKSRARFIELGIEYLRRGRNPLQGLSALNHPQIDREEDVLSDVGFVGGGDSLGHHTSRKRPAGPLDYGDESDKAHSSQADRKGQFSGSQFSSR